MMRLFGGGGGNDDDNEGEGGWSVVILHFGERLLQINFSCPSATQL